MTRAKGLGGVALAIILLVAAYVRLAHPELSWFSIDQARDAHTALGIVSGRSFPLLGVEIAGGPAHTWGPAYFYLIAVPFAVSRDPAFAVAVLSATTLAGLLMTYRLGLVLFSRPVGLLSAALVATYPLAVIESTTLWNGALVPVFAVIFFYALCSLVVHGRSVMIIPAVTALAVLVQLHLSALSLVIVLVLTVALFRPGMRAIHLVIGLGVLLALMLPYLVAQWLGGLADLRAAASSGGQFRVPGPLALGELALRVLLASPDIVAGIPALHETWRPGVLLALHRLEAWALVLGLAFAGLTAVWGSVRRGARDGSYPGVVLVTLGFAIPLVMIGARQDTKPYYFNVAYPMPFIAAALLVSRGIEWVGTIAGARARRALWAGLAMVMAVTVTVQVDFHRQMWRTIRTTGAAVWTPGRLELMAIRYKAELARILVNDFGADSPDVFLRVHGSRARDWLEDQGYFFESIRAAGRSPIAARPSPSLHYAVVRDEGDAAIVQGRRSARAGPYTVTEYRPLIEYSTWRCAQPPAGDSRLHGGEAAAAWTPVRLPTAGLPQPTMYGSVPPRSWPIPIVSCRGTVSANSPRGQRLLIVVSLRAAAQGDTTVQAFALNDASIVASQVLAHSTFAAHHVDAVFDVTEHLRDGPNELRVKIASRSSRFDLDVYEIHG
jgi:hypothetical protein